MTKEINFDITTALQSPKVILELKVRGRAIKEKQLLILLRGEGPQGSWTFSETLQGRYQYLPDMDAGQIFVKEVDGIFTENSKLGKSLTLMVFADMSKDLEDKLEWAELRIEGLKEHTCETFEERYRIDFEHSESSSSAFGTIPTGVLNELGSRTPSKIFGHRTSFALESARRLAEFSIVSAAKAAKSSFKGFGK